MRRWLLSLAVALLLGAPAQAARRALVIGNLDYADAGRFPDLATSIGDARRMADLLGAAGFQLQEFNYSNGGKLPYGLNLTRRAMEEALQAFADTVKEGDDAVVYYAGHGVQYENKVHLMGADAEFRLKANFDKESVSQEVVSATLAARKPRVTVLILDCCREQPDQTWLSSENKTRGVRGTERPASLNLPPNILVGYATSSGRKANDSLNGGDTNGPLVAALAKHWREGLEWDSLWKVVSRDVFNASSAATAGGYRVEMQMPSKYGQTVEDFYFTFPAQPPPRPVAPLPPSPATATSDKPFVNSLGMRFISLSDKLYICEHETRKKDFQEFASQITLSKSTTMTLKSDKNKALKWVEEGSWESPGFSQEIDHPVVGIAFTDAVRFADWLTLKERQELRILPNHSYRIPTINEWKNAAGESKYVWGTIWPPPAGTGNFAGNEAANYLPADSTVISNYIDYFKYTAPCESFKKNDLGIFDMEGNVREWVTGGRKQRDDSLVFEAAMGGAWTTGKEQDFFPSKVFPCAISSAGKKIGYADIGFRLVFQK